MRLRHTILLNRTLAVLTALTILSVGTARWEGSGVWASAIVLVAAWYKSRLVLDHYLGLRNSFGGWRVGFALGLGLFALAVFLLGLIPSRAG